VAALSLSMPKSRLPEGEARSYMVQRLLTTASQVSAELHPQISGALPAHVT